MEHKRGSIKKRHNLKKIKKDRIVMFAITFWIIISYENIPARVRQKTIKKRSCPLEIKRPPERINKSMKLSTIFKFILIIF